MTLEQQLRASNAITYLERRIVAPFDGEPAIDMPAALAIGAVIAALKAIRDEQVSADVTAQTRSEALRAVGRADLVPA